VLAPSDRTPISATVARSCRLSPVSASQRVPSAPSARSSGSYGSTAADRTSPTAQAASSTNTSARDPPSFIASSVPPATASPEISGNRGSAISHWVTGVP
jgi:hypothetical protein